MGASWAGNSVFEDRILPVLNELPEPDCVIDYRTGKGLEVTLGMGRLSLPGMTVHWVQGVDGEPLPDGLVPERFKVSRQHEILRANKWLLKHILPERCFVPEETQSIDAYAIASFRIKSFTAFRAQNPQTWRQFRNILGSRINREVIEYNVQSSRPSTLNSQTI